MSHLLPETSHHTPKATSLFQTTEGFFVFFYVLTFICIFPLELSANNNRVRDCVNCTVSGGSFPDPLSQAIPVLMGLRSPQGPHPQLLLLSPADPGHASCLSLCRQPGQDGMGEGHAGGRAGTAALSHCLMGREVGWTPSPQEPLVTRFS